MEVGQRALEVELSSHPDMYAGLWSAENTDANGETAVSAVVVGTVVEVDTVAARLHSMYPFNLCVVRVEYSDRDLQEVAGLITKLNRPWDVQVDPSVNRVVVRVPVLDRPTVDALDPYSDKVEIRAIVERAAD